MWQRGKVTVSPKPIARRRRQINWNEVVALLAICMIVFCMGALYGLSALGAL